jgi:hypothetical protein
MVEQLNEKAVEANAAESAAKGGGEVRAPRAVKRKAKTKKASATAQSAKPSRSRREKPYPLGTFDEVRSLGEAIFKLAGDKIRRLTLLEKIGRSPTSGATRALIIASNKYGITKGSYAADYLELTPDGKLACDETRSAQERLGARIRLAILNVPPFNTLYEEYAGKRLPAPEVMKDFLDASPYQIEDPKECLDTFIVNLKSLGLLRLIAGAETLIPIDQALEEVGGDTTLGRPMEGAARVAPGTGGGTTWDRTCFYVSPIGDEGSEQRRHADLFMASIVEPAVAELGLTVVRADQIGEPGMITSQVLEHLRYAGLVIADLSHLNPNVFYEMALRHACRRPIVQIIRRADRLPFDTNQVRTVVVDTTDIYSLIPRIPTYVAEVAAQARKALEDPEHAGNPITVFFPKFWT